MVQKTKGLVQFAGLVSRFLVGSVLSFLITQISTIATDNTILYNKNYINVSKSLSNENKRSLFFQKEDNHFVFAK